MTLFASGQSDARRLAALGSRGEPAHVAVAALGEEGVERFARAVHRIGRGEADCIEAKRLGLLRDPCFQRLSHSHYVGTP